MPNWFLAVVSALLAGVPVLLWLRIIKKEGEEKKLYIKTFLVGTFAVIPPLLLIILFEYFPSLNIYALIHKNITNAILAALLTNGVVGIIEEIAKNLIVRVIDKRHPEYIQTIGAALKLSICAGLGFSFAENIFYFYTIWISPQYGATDLFSTFVFRSVFTMAGHMVFSGIFGYYFGIGKFAADITEYARFQGRGLHFIHLISRITGRMTFQVVRELKNLKGLFIAMGLHAMFNATLDLHHKLPAIIIVGASLLYIRYLLQTTTGHLLFSVTKRRASTMAPKDEDVVLELLGMWTKEGRLQEVVGICDRLLARDPDNNVVKLFRAKSKDNQELKHFYGIFKQMFAKHPEAVNESAYPSLNLADEKIIMEVMDMWYKEGRYKEVLDVANRLLARNPESSGAKLLLQKAMDREKLRKVFEALKGLFQEE